jgi:hypothetical protein
LPTLNKVAGTVAYILPQALVSQRFGNIGEQFERYSIVKPEQAAILIKAARLYQDAIWLVESQPEMSWLLLVSALETAAGYWRATNEYPVDRLRASKPELEKFLLEAGGAELLSTVADQIADYMGATKKFIDFVLNFLPPPPPERPPEGLQHPWDERSMKKSLSTIYNWRSKALHSGIPFPHPMCSPPIRVENGLNEKPIGLGSYAFGGTWVAKDIPMLFHTFEYIARHALLNWWNSLVESI